MGATKLSDEELIEKAKQAYAQAYAPYSNYSVGAVLLTRAGTVLLGCNVEDATMNLGVCAERAAIINGVITDGPTMKIDTIAVTAKTPGPCAPCGNCRQLFSEFADPQSRLIFDNGDGFRPYQLAELLPYTYTLKPQPV